MTRARSGIALVTVLLVLAAAAVLVFGMVFTTQIELRIARNDVTYTQANYVAQAGLEKYKTSLFQTFRWSATNGAGGSTVCGNSLNNGIDLNRDGDTDDAGESWSGGTLSFGPEYVHASYDTNGNGIGEPVGSYTVTIYRGNVEDYFVVRSTGDSNGAQATVEAVLEASSGGILRNAVFAGVGGGNAKFNGGATVRGGVYVYGEGDELEDGTDDDAPVMATNGNFGVYNDYDLSDNAYDTTSSHVRSDLRSNGQLCASFRIYDGQIDVGSSAVSLGSQSNPLLGVYVDDGFDDPATRDILVKNNIDDIDDTCKKNGGVCANTVGPFDLEEGPELPLLDGATDGTMVDCSGTQTTWESCLRNDTDGVVAEIGGADPFSTCVANEIDANNNLRFGGASIDCRVDHDGDGTLEGFYFNDAANTLEIVGNVTFENINLVVDDPIRYRVYGRESGAATTSASIAVVCDGSCGSEQGNVLFEENFLPDETYNVWPDQVLSVISENEVRQRGDHLIAQVYATNRFRTEGQNVLYGQVITDEFCTTSAGGDECNAGQSSEVVYLTPSGNSPEHFKSIDPSGGGDTFRVLSYNLR